MSLILDIIGLLFYFLIIAFLPCVMWVIDGWLSKEPSIKFEEVNSRKDTKFLIIAFCFIILTIFLFYLFVIISMWFMNDIYIIRLQIILTVWFASSTVFILRNLGRTKRFRWIEE